MTDLNASPSLCPEEYVLITTVISCIISGLTMLGHLFYYNDKKL